ncbi:MAG: PilZ domain-containing protein [Gammaproteobacteria bacterium]|nr:PilZ domain-containing protein [Gammaproteobacteria bacterium]
MFWKKSKTIEVDLPKRYDDHRDAFRIAPDKNRPVLLSLLGNTFHALNISGTGVCIRSHNFNVGQTINGTISLPSEDKIFTVTLTIITKQKDLCRCAFSKIHPEAQDLLHHYILELQKRHIVLNRRN